MKADYIIKNAKIFTSDKNNPKATAFAVKDGKFIYVGDEAGLSQYEGKVEDLGGKFIMPGIIDSHVHVTIGVAFDYVDLGVRFEPDGKKGAMEFMSAYIKEHPGQKCYRFLVERHYLKGEEITKEDLDAVCPDSELILLEGECHSNWVNSKVLERMGIHDDTPDPVPGLAYYVRKDGHVTGNSYETASWPILFDGTNELTKEQILASVQRWIDFSKEAGVSAVFDAGFPEHNSVHERMYECLCELDKQGKLPIYIDGCYVLTRPSKMHEAIEEVKRFGRKFNTEHLKVHTLKIFMDGTLKIETAAQVEPYVDTGVTGTTAFTPAQMAEILCLLNEAGLDLHVHTVVGGEGDGGFECVDGTGLAVPGIGCTPDDGDVSVLDLVLLVEQAQGPQQTGGVAGDDPGELYSPGFLVVGGGVEGYSGETVLLSSLEDSLDSRGLVFGLVFLSEVSGGGVNHDVDLSDEIVDGSCDLDSRLVELLDVLCGNVQGDACCDCGLCLEGGPGLGHSDEFHVVLHADCGCHPFTDGTVSVYSDLDFSHGDFTWFSVFPYPI